ncbi:hypothetical protein GUJ93_ZPchr0003g18128 [Zizania palustris]|uniref:Uncharacterized protein n=1 Tax=Zizania palustris TaxID=103762 RepID=A0A8J5SA61_ZIZPA|nr:hypothetical protein GUJ93_ZPchr0003g18128 [Zizania palustris]
MDIVDQCMSLRDLVEEIISLCIPLLRYLGGGSIEDPFVLRGEGKPKGKAPIEVVNLSRSNDGARSMEALEGASHHSVPSSSKDARKFVVLAQGAMTSYDNECDRLEGEAVRL